MTCLRLFAQNNMPKVIPDPFPFQFREKTVSFFILGALIRKAVPAAIEFDCQLCDGAIEIQKVDAAGVLAAEFEFVEAMVTQQPPQAFLGVRGFFAELAGELD